VQNAQGATAAWGSSPSLIRPDTFFRQPLRGVLGNWTSGVRNSRKPNLYHCSFLETLYIGVILCAEDWDYARMHEQLSGV